MKYQIIVFLSFLFFLTACPSEEDTILLDHQFSLDFGAEASLHLDALTIEFESVVEDSRCPSGSLCTWAGQVIITIKIDHMASRTLSLNQEQTATEYNGFKITLLDVNPYPNSSEQTKNKDYSISLLVTEL